MATTSRTKSPLTLAVTIATLLLILAIFASDAPAQVVTYQAVTEGNTSASVGAITPSPLQNVSKATIGSVLPTGVNPQIYAHLSTWFGSSTHADVGYSSTDANQVQKQVQDMLSRGIGGVIVNWQGPSDYTNQAAELIMTNAQNQSGNFVFSIEEDARALSQCAQTSGCDLPSRIISDLTYVQNTYAGSAAYMKMQNRPVIFLYGMEAYQLNWATIRSSLPGNPILVFRAANSVSTQVMATVHQPEVRFRRGTQHG